MKKIKENSAIFIFVCLFFMLIGLLFNDNVWFDETYTLALIRHNYGEMMQILRVDMHPPLYFMGLKLFCSVLGYNVITTKLFSLIGFIMMMLLGCFIVKKDYGNNIVTLYLIMLGVTPMSYYFSVQQRCYSWAMFFVTWCFLEGMRLVEKKQWRTIIPFTMAALGAAYNHIYSLVAVAGIVLCINGFVLFRQREELCKVLVADVVMILGYAGWLYFLLLQTKSAFQNFWQTSLEVNSLIVFVITLVLFAVLLLKRENRCFLVITGMLSIMFVHMVGFCISILVRPLYIARYAAPLLGVFALVVAICLSNLKKKMRRNICICLVLVLILEYVISVAFEYNPSIQDFREEFNAVYSVEDVFLYCDSSFGIMSFYYPENRHICTYHEPWFDAFENVEWIKKDDITDEMLENRRIWFVINEKMAIPEWVRNRWGCEKRFSFRSDFNRFDVWSLS